MSAKKPKCLTNLFIKSAKKGRYSDNLNNLYLQVTATGLKSWLFRYSIYGARREMGLGRIENLSLSDARKKASILFQQKRDNPAFDPINERQKEQVQSRLIINKDKTFVECMDEFIAIKCTEWTNKKHAQQWTNSLTTYALPFVGKLPVKTISTEHIKQLLKPIWHTKTETATRVRNRIEQILDFALANQYYQGENPARWRGHLDKILPKPTKIKKVKHHSALPYRDINTFVSKLRTHKSMSAYALEFLILTAARTGSVIKANWEEIDFDNRVWSIPASHMKGGIAHDIPLNDRAIEILDHLHESKVNEFIFVGQTKGGGLSNAAMDKCLQITLEYNEITVHGFRSTFRDWAGEETATPNFVCEMALAHKIASETEKSYRRGDLLEKRRKLMKEWEVFMR